MNEVILIDKTTAPHRAHLERNRLCSVFLCSRINIYEPEKGPKQYGNDLQRPNRPFFPYVCQFSLS